MVPKLAAQRGARPLSHGNAAGGTHMATKVAIDLCIRWNIIVAGMHSELRAKEYLFLAGRTGFSTSEWPPCAP